MTIEQLQKEAEKLGYKLVKIKSYERFLPCICGCNQREFWTCYGGEDPILFVCKKCGKKATGKNKADAKRNWNKMIQEAIND